MASRTQQIPIADFNVKANLPAGLEAISRPAGEAGAAQFKAGQETEYWVSRIADEFAKVEGAKGGQLAGNDPGFRPTGMTTLRGRAFDEAATTVYTNNLEAKLDADMRTAALENRDNPGALTQKLDDIKKDYAQRHVFPEIAGQFNAKFEAMRTRLTIPTLERQLNATQAAARASSEGLREALRREAGDVSEMPDGPDKEQALKDVRARLRQTYQNDVTNGGDAVDAARGLLKDQASIDVRRTLAPLEKITDPEAYAAAGEKALEQAKKKGGVASQAAIDSIEVEIAKGVNQRVTAAKQSEARLKTLTQDQFERASKGFPITERETAAMREQAQTPAEKALVETGIRRSTAASAIAHMTPLDLEALSIRLRTQAREKGATPEDVERIQLIDKVKEERTKILKKDPVADAAVRGVPVSGPVEMGLANSSNPADLEKLKNQFLMRKPMKAYVDDVGGADYRLTQAEQDNAKAIIARGGVAAERMVKAITGGMGDQAPGVLREIGGEDLLHVGVLSTMPGPSRDQTVKDVVNGVALQNNDELKGKLPKRPDSADELFRSVYGTTIGSEDKARIMRTAEAIYTQRAYRNGVKKEDAQAETIFTDALRDATGQVKTPQGRTFGGPASYSPNWYTSSKKVIAPPNVQSNKFGDVINSIRDEDLEGAVMADGSKITASQVKSATPVATPAGYKFAMGDPASKDPKFLGKPNLVIDFNTMEKRLRTRVPGAFE